MRYAKRSAWLLVLILTLSGPAHAGSPRDEKVIALLKDSTFAVIRINVEQADPKALYAWFEDPLHGAGLSQDEIAAFQQAVRGKAVESENWIVGFRKAGGRQLYVAVNYPVLMDLPYVTVPIEKGADPSAIAAELEASEFIKFGPHETPDTEPADPHEREEIHDHTTVRAESIGGVVAFGTLSTLEALKANAAKQKTRSGGRRIGCGDDMATEVANAGGTGMSLRSGHFVP